MPLPILFIAIAGVSAATGVGKSVKAGIDQKDASETNSAAKNIIDRATEEINQRRKESGDAITALGEKKIWVLDKSVKRFVLSFDKLQHVDFTKSTGIEELDKIKIDKQSMEGLRKMQTMATSMVGGVAGGTLMGLPQHLELMVRQPPLQRHPQAPRSLL